MPRPKTTHFSETNGFLALVPQASKKHLAKKQLRDPSGFDTVLISFNNVLIGFNGF